MQQIKCPYKGRNRKNHLNIFLKFISIIGKTSNFEIKQQYIQASINTEETLKLVNRKNSTPHIQGNNIMQNNHTLYRKRIQQIIRQHNKSQINGTE